jgi:hypothetical protein
MTHPKLRQIIISEFGTDWTSHADLTQSPVRELVTLVQRRTEAPHAFAHRVRAKLEELGSVASAALLCSPAADRHSLAARHVMIDGCLHAMRGVPHRELALVCSPTRGGLLPAWVDPMAVGIEEQDPAVELSVECQPHSVAA